MAKGKKTGGKDWIPGQSGNPKGLTPIPADIKEARKLTQLEFERLVNKYLYGSKQALAESAAKPDTPVLELLIGSIVHKAVVEGDERRLNFLLDRLIGKVTEKLSHSGPNGEPIAQHSTVIVIPSNGREAKQRD